MRFPRLQKWVTVGLNGMLGLVGAALGIDMTRTGVAFERPAGIVRTTAALSLAGRTHVGPTRGPITTQKTRSFATDGSVGQRRRMAVPGTNASESPSPSPPPLPSMETVVLMLTASGSVSDYSDTSSLRQGVATAAGVDTPLVTISVAAASVIITATINIPASTTAALVQTALASTLSTAAAASIALGVTVEEVPAVTIAPSPPPPPPLSGLPPPGLPPPLASSEEVFVIDGIAGGIIGGIVGALPMLLAVCALMHFRRRRKRVTAPMIA